MSEPKKPTHTYTNLYDQYVYNYDKMVDSILPTQALKFIQKQDTPENRQRFSAIPGFDANNDVLAEREAKSGLPASVDKKPATVGFKFI